MSVFMLIIAAAAPNVARSQDTQYILEEDTYGLITTVNIQVSDQVSDGCWTNASRVAAMMRLLFEQNGVVVKQEELAFAGVPGRVVFAVVVGYRTSGGICVANAQFEARHWASVKIGGFDGGTEYYASGSVATGEKSTVFSVGTNLNEELLGFFEEATMSFVADIISARRAPSVVAFKTAYPNYGSNVLTQSEWDKIVNTANQ